MSDLVIDALAATGVASSMIVTVELTDGRGDPIVGYVDGTPEVIILPTTVTTDINGQVTIDLVPTASILPGNSCYTIRIAHKQFLIQKSGASETLFEALVNDPGDLDPINTDFLLRANNLSDLEDPAVARDNLGLGDSATLDVGTTAGTVAAGDDPRFDIAPDHIADTVDAHDATAISFAPTVSIPADDVQEAIEYVMANASGGGGGTNDHNVLINRNAADQHPASSITNTPTGTVSSTTVQAAVNELDGDIQAHLADAVDAHDASAISMVPFSTISATDVQSGLQQVYAAAVTGLDQASEISFAPTGDIIATNVQNAIVEVDGEFHAHETLATGAHAASAITFTPASGITSVNAQTAIVEALTDSLAYTDAHINDTTAAHVASSIGFTPTGTISATDVQAAIAEVATDTAAGFVPINGSYAATSTDVASSRVTGNVNPRFTWNADGTLEWGDGTATLDVNLYRSAANVLKTDDTFQPNQVQLPFGSATLQARNSGNSAWLDLMSLTSSNLLTVGSSSAGATIVNAGASQTISFAIGGATQTAVTSAISLDARAGTTASIRASSNVNSTTAAGGISFGLSNDTNLYRSAADTLKTDDSLIIAGFPSPTTPALTVSSQLSSLTGLTDVFSNSFTLSNAATEANIIRAEITQITKTGAGDHTSSLRAGQFQVVNNASGTGNITEIRALQGFVSNAGSGTIATGSAIFAAAPSAVAAGNPITTANGLFVEGQTATGVTNGYGVNIQASKTAALWVNSNTNPTAQSGGILFGSSQDTNLYRSAADTLKTDDSFQSLRIGLGTAPTSNRLSLVAGTTAADGIDFGGDTNLYRSATDNLKTDDTFSAAALVSTNGGAVPASAGAIRIPNNSGFRARNAANSGDISFFLVDANDETYIQTASSGKRVIVSAPGGLAIDTGSPQTLWIGKNSLPTTSAGGIFFGSAQDTNLYRSAADVLTTDDSLTVGTALRVNGNSGFYNTAPIAQPSTTGESAGFTAGAGTTVTHLSTFTGNSGTKAYTLSDIVKHLKALGLLASS